MEYKLGQEPMFANNNTNGFSQRFYAACAAMQGMLSNYNLLQDCIKDARQRKTTPENELIDFAYKFADELLKHEYDEQAT